MVIKLVKKKNKFAKNLFTKKYKTKIDKHKKFAPNIIFSNDFFWKDLDNF